MCKILAFRFAYFRKSTPNEKSRTPWSTRRSEYNKPRFSIKLFEKRGSFILAQWEGFEPSSRFSGYTISNRARYDHFDTTACHKVKPILFQKSNMNIIAGFFYSSSPNVQMLTTKKGRRKPSRKRIHRCGNLWSVPPWEAAARPTGDSGGTEKREKRGGLVHIWPVVLTSVEYHTGGKSDGRI